MSLFDTLKYPLSTPVTLVELAAIPEQIFVAWVTHENFQSFPKESITSYLRTPELCPQSVILDWFVRYNANSPPGISDLQLLRKLIYELV